LAEHTLQELKLSDEGVLVLGILRSDEKFLGSPRGDTVVKPADTLILYGRTSNVARLDQRRKGPGGNIQHAEAVAVQKIKTRQEQTDEWT
jgi:uncharacterized protein with PhoU and TrkA domain